MASLNAPCAHGRVVQQSAYARSCVCDCSGVQRRRVVCKAQLIERVQEAPVLSPELSRTTAVLEVPNESAPGGKTRVYVLAMSHVSAKSCEQTRELIAAVKPEVVMLELCKDRLGLLVDQESIIDRKPQVWHCPKVTLTGFPEGPGYPLADAVKARLSCKPGKVVSTLDIEGDVVRLQATGLFRTVTPVARNATMTSAPMFWAHGGRDEDDGGFALDTIPPLEEIEFRLEQRVLPRVTAFSCRLDSSVAPLGVDLSADELSEVSKFVLDEAKADGCTTVSLLMRASAMLKEKAASPAPIEVIFYGAESGVVEAVVHASRGHPDAVSGLEPSAVDGEGVGITPFINPNRTSDVQVGLTSRIPQEAVERIARSRQVVANLSSGEESEVEEAVAGPSAQPLPEDTRRMLKTAARRTQWRDWGWAELARAEDETPEPQPLKDALADILTLNYSKFQTAAAEKIGIDGGAAWRAALDEAIKNGASQIVLGDRPALITQRRLAQGVWGALAPRAIGALALLNLSVFGGAFGVLPAEAAVGGEVTAAALTLSMVLPVLGPLFEVWRFSTMSAEEIERVVAVSEPIQQNLDAPMKLYGEDALLDWPGAFGSVIDERDDFMARSLAAAARGADGQAPAFVVDFVDGQYVLRYMMAEGAPNKAAPAGTGDGVYQPLQGASSVVAVVGSAHVRGICKRWQEAQQDVSVERFLQS